MTEMIEPVALGRLNEGFRGELLQPGDSGYDDARVLWNGLFDRRPALIARCRDKLDVVAAVNFGRDSGLTIAVRSGGGLVVGARQMKGSAVDPGSGTCRAEPGLTWAEFDTATQEHALAVTGG